MRTNGGEVGIPFSKAQEYYKIALAAAKDVIENGPYKLMLASEQTHKAYADNFYKAVCQKDGNTEVIGVVIMSLRGKHISSLKETCPKV